MPVKKKRSRQYFSILKHSEKQPEGGLLRNVDRNGNESFYGQIEGILTGIELQEDEWEGNPVFKYHFKFEGPDHNAVDILQVGESSSAARGILQTLICCEQPIGWVSISPYRKESDGKTYTNVWVEVNNQEIEWKDEVTEKIPDVQEHKNAAGETMYDDSRRRVWFRKVAQHISEKKLAGGIVQPDGSVTSVKGSDEQPTSPAEMNGKQQAEALHGAPKEDTPSSDNESGDNVDMDNWNGEIDDDLPF